MTAKIWPNQYTPQIKSPQGWLVYLSRGESELWLKVSIQAQRHNPATGLEWYTHKPSPAYWSKNYNGDGPLIGPDIRFPQEGGTVGIVRGPLMHDRIYVIHASPDYGFAGEDINLDRFNDRWRSKNKNVFMLQLDKAHGGLILDDNFDNTAK